MRQVLCFDCAQEHWPDGTRQIYARSRWGEPAEYQRLTYGVARRPKPVQRTIQVNDVPWPLLPDNYDCDCCGKAIQPGDRCAAWTVWTENDEPIREWEWEYLEKSA